MGNGASSRKGGLPARGGAEGLRVHATIILVILLVTMGLVPGPAVGDALTNPSSGPTPGNGFVGGSPAYDVSFTTVRPIPKNGTVRVQFPTGFDVRQATITNSDGCASAMNKVVLTTLTDFEAKFTQACPAASLVRFSLAAVTPRARAGPASPIHVTTHDDAGTQLDAAPATGMWLWPKGGDLRSSMLVFDPAKGATTNYTFQGIPTSPIPSAGGIVVAFPTGYSFSPGAVAWGASACGTIYRGVPQGLTVNMARVAGSECSTAEPINVVVNGVKNPTATGPTGDIHFSTRDANGADLDYGRPLRNRVSDLLSIDPVSIQDDGPNAAYTFGFAGAPAWPEDWSLRIGFPPTFDVAEASLAAGSGCGAPMIMGSEGNFVIVTAATDEACPAGSRTVTIDNMVPPPFGEPLGHRPAVYLLDESGEIVATNLNLVIGASAPLFTAPLLIAQNDTTSKNTIYGFSFATAAPWPAGGKLEILFPPGFTFDAPTVSLGGSPPQGAATATPSENRLVITREGNEWSGVSRKYVNISGVVNADAPGLHASVYALLRNAQGTPIVSGPLGNPSLRPALDSAPGPIADVVSKQFPPAASAWSKPGAGSFSWQHATDLVGLRGYVFAIDATAGGNFTAGNSTGPITVTAKGFHNFSVRAVDRSGQLGPIHNYTFRIDSEKPVLGTITADRGTTCTNEPTATLSWPEATDNGSSLDPASTYWVQARGGPIVKTTGRSATVQLVSGNNTVEVLAKDGAGNFGKGSIVLRHDATPPKVTLSAPSQARGEFLISWTATDDCFGAESYVIDWRQGSDQPFEPLYVGTANKTLVPAPELGDGLLGFRGYAIDGGGRTGVPPLSAIATTLFDATSPQAPGTPSAKSGRVQVILSWPPSSDPGSGIAGYHVYRSPNDLSAFQRLTPAFLPSATHNDPVAGLKNGTTYWYRVTAVDKAGNEGPPSQPIEVLVDTRVTSAASADALDFLSIFLNTGKPVASMRAIDADQDGTYEDIESSTSEVRLRRAVTVGQQSALLLQGPDAEDLALWLPDPGYVHSVVPVSGEPIGLETMGDNTTLRVRVSKHNGWILAKVPDAYAGRSLLSVLNATGVPLPEGQFYRDEGSIFFLDDPDVEYVIVLGTTGVALEAASSVTPFAILAGAGAAVVLASWIGLSLVAVRARRLRAQVARLQAEADAGSLPIDETAEQAPAGVPGTPPDAASVAVARLRRLRGRLVRLEKGLEEGIGPATYVADETSVLYTNGSEDSMQPTRDNNYTPASPATAAPGSAPASTTNVSRRIPE